MKSKQAAKSSESEGTFDKSRALVRNNGINKAPVGGEGYSFGVGDMSIRVERLPSPFSSFNTSTRTHDDT
jgi:hypothetical protein